VTSRALASHCIETGSIDAAAPHCPPLGLDTHSHQIATGK